MRRVFILLLLTCIPFAACYADLFVDFTRYAFGGDSFVYSLGFQFSVNEPLSVTALGAFDWAENGFPQPQQVGLWTDSGTLLASTYVSNSDSLQGSWRFHEITPVQLTTGETYRIASQGGERYTFWTTGFTVAPEITFLRDRSAYVGDTSNNPLHFPTATQNFTVEGGGGFFGGNAIFATEEAVPEPASIALIGAGLLALVVLRRRRVSQRGI